MNDLSSDTFFSFFSGENRVYLNPGVFRLQI